MEKLASVVVTTYNGERYIEEQLESIKSQTYNNIEVFVVDDKSSDSTIRLVEKFIISNNLSKMWHLVCNEANKGWRTNFIDGLKLCSGDYLFPCDQDDIWDARKIEIMISVMENNKNINVLASNICEFSPDGKRAIRPNPENGRIQKHVIVKNYFDNEYPGCSFCVRKSFFEEILPYWWKQVPHDALLWRYSMFSDSLYTIGTSLLKQRIHLDSTYQVESLKNKNVSSKLAEIEYMSTEVENLKRFTFENGNTSKKVEKILDESAKWLKSRKRLYEDFSLKNCMSLLMYLPYYERKRKYLLDVLLARKNRSLKK